MPALWPFPRVGRITRVVLVAACLAFAGAGSAGRAEAHSEGISSSEFSVEDDGRRVSATIAFAASDVARAGHLDRDGDGVVTPEEARLAREDLRGFIDEGIGLRRGDVPCEGRVEAAELDEGDGLTFQAHYECPPSGSPLEATFFLLDELGPGHGHLCTMSTPITRVQRLLTPTSRAIAVDLPAPSTPSTRSGPRVAVAALLLGAVVAAGLLAIRAVRRRRLPMARRVVADSRRES